MKKRLYKRKITLGRTIRRGAIQEKSIQKWDNTIQEESFMEEKLYGEETIYKEYK